MTFAPRRLAHKSKRPRLATEPLPMTEPAAYLPKRYTKPLCSRKLFCFVPLKCV